MSQPSTTSDGEADVLVDDPAPHVRRLTLNRPQALNALSMHVLTLIGEHLGRATDEEDIRAVVLTGGLDIFSAGADIKEFSDRSPAAQIRGLRGRAWRRIAGFPKPMIAAVNGYALGGGLELALACDFIIAGAKAQFGLPEVRLGIIPGAGGTQRLPRSVGKSLAMKTILTAEFIDAGQALAAGLVAEVVPPAETIERALVLAQTIASRPPLAVQVAKEAVLKSLESGIDQGILFEQRSNAALISTEDRQEAVRAFREKRQGIFKGR